MKNPERELSQEEPTDVAKEGGEIEFGPQTEVRELLQRAGLTEFQQILNEIEAEKQEKKSKETAKKIRDRVNSVLGEVAGHVPFRDSRDYKMAFRVLPWAVDSKHPMFPAYNRVKEILKADKEPYSVKAPKDPDRLESYDLVEDRFFATKMPRVIVEERERKDGNMAMSIHLLSKEDWAKETEEMEKGRE